mgnify:CR=1 FL=1
MDARLKVHTNKRTNQLVVNLSRRKLAIDENESPKFIKVRREDLEWL